MTERSVPPVARKDHHETVLHGLTLSDDYAWLRDKDAPEVTEFLNAENAYSEALTADLAPLRDELYNEMLSHIKQTDESAPYREGDWWYYVRTEEGKQYSIFCRRAGSATSPEDPEQIILDGNQLAEGQAFFAIGATDISDDGRWLAYTVDLTGFRQYTLHIKDLETGETLPGEVERVGSVTWASDNTTLFYSVEDEEQKRQFQLYRHTLHAPHSTDVLVYQDDDERFNIG
ncbi:MAG TPA: oligopeptidase B, partial [Chloroflexota bacterium]|nr:oligopeptidase B [Chloroflexota bacterium]